MSYTLVPYLVDLDELRRVVGSGDAALLERARERAPDTFAEPERDEDDEEVSVGTALRHLVMGEPPQADSAHQYGYALEHLCAVLGRGLDAGWWEAIRWPVLDATGMSEVLDSGPPVPLPKIADFPRIGFLEPPAIAALAARAAAGPLASIAPSGKRRKPSIQQRLLLGVVGAVFRLPSREPLTPEELRDCLDEAAAWLREATGTGKGLVFFYY